MEPSKMISVREEVSFARTELKSRGGVYFSAIMLCTWDNIHGPKILYVWTGAQKASPGIPSGETLLAIGNYTLNDEAGRAEKLDEVEQKFYALKMYDVIASAFIFKTEVVRGKTDIYSFVLVLPYSELSEYLARYSLCQEKIRALLTNFVIAPLTTVHTGAAKVSLKDRLADVVTALTGPLLKFTLMLRSTRYNTLPDRIHIGDTYLGTELERKVTDWRPFLLAAITCHLQTAGYSIVLGESAEVINKMILTLALFLSDKERKMSRLVWREETERDEREEDRFLPCGTYEPGLFLQGYKVSADAFLPFCRADLWDNRLPCTVIHMDSKEVRVVEPPQKIPLYLRKKAEPDGIRSKKTMEPLLVRDLPAYETRELCSRIVHDFFDQLRLLSLTQGVRESFIAQFVRLLKLKALAVTKYAMAEPKPAMQQAGEQFANVLALRTSAPDRPKVNLAALQQDLSIEMNGDLYVVLAFAEKMKTGTYFDVLGDPQQQAEAVIREFEAF